MTNPGELEKVPIKIVPIYIEPVLEEYVDPPAAPPVEVPPGAKSTLIGQLAFASALLTVVAHVAAVIVASSNAWATGTVVGYVAIGLSVVAIVGGTVAVILKRGLRFGVAAIAVGVAANPFVLLQVLRFVSGVQT